MKLSIVTICRNAGAGLRNTVNAVLSQSRLPDEYLIQDGDSSDGSVADLVGWLWEKAEKLPPSRFAATADKEKLKKEWGGEISLCVGDCAMRIRSEPDAGIYDALNRGVACAQGDVIGLLHAGDVYARQDVLANVMRAFEGGAEAVYGDLQYVRAAPDGGLRVVRHWKSGSYARAKLRWGWMPPHPALFLRREVYERAALSAGVYFDAAFRCAGDYDFILRVLPTLQVPPVYLREVLVQMRTGGISNRSLQHILVKSREDWLAIRRNHAGGLHTLIGKNLQKVGQFHASS